MQPTIQPDPRPANHPDKIQRTDDEIDNGDYAEYLWRQADAWAKNPPAAPAGFELVPCEATPRHWPTYTITDDDFYPSTCSFCWTAGDQERIRDLEHRLHRPWMRWKATHKLLGWLYSLGVVKGYGVQNCQGCPSWVLSGRVRFGASSYVLFVKRETWRCLRAGHVPGDPIGFGYCSKCLPCPACGSKTAGHADDCPDAC